MSGVRKPLQSTLGQDSLLVGGLIIFEMVNRWSWLGRGLEAIPVFCGPQDALVGAFSASAIFMIDTFFVYYLHFFSIYQQDLVTPSRTHSYMFTPSGVPLLSWPFLRNQKEVSSHLRMKIKSLHASGNQRKDVENVTRVENDTLQAISSC